MCQVGYEPEELAVTSEMVEAGANAFVAWFSQDHLAPCLVSLPEGSDISELASSIFCQMAVLKPVS